MVNDFIMVIEYTRKLTSAKNDTVYTISVPRNYVVSKMIEQEELYKINIMGTTFINKPYKCGLYVNNVPKLKFNVPREYIKVLKHLGSKLVKIKISPYK